MAFVFGTRPEAIKVAPVLLAMRDNPHLQPLVFVTGQHRQMLDQVLEVFGITPDQDLEILQHGQGLTGITTKALERLSPVVEQHQPDVMVVQGDTTTTFAGAARCVLRQDPRCAHGGRSADERPVLAVSRRDQPPPHIANLSVHLAPTSTSCENLVREGFDRSSILITGNTVIDALLWTVNQRVPYQDPRLEALDHHDRPVLLVTAHRRESWGDGMRAIGDTLARIAHAKPELTIALPLHKNQWSAKPFFPVSRDRERHRYRAAWLRRILSTDEPFAPDLDR